MNPVSTKQITLLSQFVTGRYNLKARFNLVVNATAVRQKKLLSTCWWDLGNMKRNEEDFRNKSRVKAGDGREAAYWVINKTRNIFKSLKIYWEEKGRKVQRCLDVRGKVKLSRSDGVVGNLKNKEDVFWKSTMEEIKRRSENNWKQRKWKLVKIKA